MPRITPEELGRLYRLHARALRLYLRQWPAGDEDLVQDAFIKLAQQSPAPEQVLPWLYRVVRNGALAAGRSGPQRSPEAPPPGPGERLGSLVCRHG
jgi:DNA-directed RNA polymerase specialized sigma24 family protein